MNRCAGVVHADSLSHCHVSLGHLNKIVNIISNMVVPETKCFSYTPIGYYISLDINFVKQLTHSHSHTSLLLPVNYFICFSSWSQK